MTDFSTIENYINQLELAEKEFVQHRNTDVLGASVQSTTLKKIIFNLKCLSDFGVLHLKLLFQKKTISQKNIVFVSPNLCRFEHDTVTVPLLNPLPITNILYLNNSKEIYISKIQNQKVYNIGGLVNVLNTTIFKSKPAKLKTVYAHRWINDSVLKRLHHTNVYTLCHYDLNGLSIAFSKCRKNFTYFEVQHGSMIHFYPYVTPAHFAIVDGFYVRNTATMQYLKSHLAKNYTADYRFIPYPKSNTVVQKGTHILYASSIETNGFHPVFISFLKNNSGIRLHITVRLHPRELHQKALFEADLKKYNVNYSFDESKNWLLANTIQNLIVISPWSSVIEEALDNGFKTIIIDEMGQKRFRNYIDNENCFFDVEIEKRINQFTSQDSTKY